VGAGRAQRDPHGQDPRLRREVAPVADLASLLRLIRLIRSAVDLDDIPEDTDGSVRAERGILAGAPMVGTVGRLDAQEAPLDFVRMATKVTELRRRSLREGRGGGARRRCSPLADRLGVALLLTGSRPDVARDRLRLRRVCGQLPLRRGGPRRDRGDGLRSAGGGHSRGRRGRPRHRRGDWPAGARRRARGAGRECLLDAGAPMEAAEMAAQARPGSGCSLPGSGCAPRTTSTPSSWG
jgi:hypothetical protein